MLHPIMCSAYDNREMTATCNILNGTYSLDNILLDCKVSQTSSVGVRNTLKWVKEVYEVMGDARLLVGARLISRNWKSSVTLHGITVHNLSPKMFS